MLLPILLVACSGAPPEPDVERRANVVAEPGVAGVDCSLTVTADRAATGGAALSAVDGKTSTFLRTGYDNWQRIDLDYGCLGELSGVRRMMTRDGVSSSGARTLQGERISYSPDGTTFTALTAATSAGWQGYVNYAPTAWHSVPYGWSAWINPKAPVKARVVRFEWDGDKDALNEVEVNFRSPRLPSTASLEAAQGAALGRLREVSRTRPRLRLAGGLPRFVRMEVPIPGALPREPVAQARDFLVTHKALYRLDDPATQMQPKRIRDGNDLRHVVFQQVERGVPVYGAGLAVHMTKDQVIATSGSYVPTIPDARPATVKAADAEAAAIAQISGSGKELERAGDTKLMYFNEGLFSGRAAETRLAWRVMVRGRRLRDGMGTYWKVFVDAMSRQPLWAIDQTMSHTAAKDFDIMTANNSTSSICWNFTDSGSTTDWFDAAGPIPPPGGYPGAAADPFLDGRHAFDFSHLTYDFYYTNFHLTSYDGDEAEVESMVHTGLGQLGSSNAAFVSSCGMTWFNDNMVTRDIFAHEFTHGVTAHSSDLEYADQPGALNESYSDVMAALLDGDWIQGTGSAGGLRSLSNPPAFGQPDHRSGLLVRPANQAPDFSVNDNGFVHTNSGIPNKAAFLITDGGTFHGVTVTGIGREKVKQLYFHVLTAGLLTGCSSFRDARDNTVLVAGLWAQIGLHGFTAADACQVINGFGAVDMGPTDLDCDGRTTEDGDIDDGDGVADALDNCPSTFNPAQENHDPDALGDACDADMDNDGLLNGIDNCPTASNPNQADLDFDRTGDACDDDEDGDQIANGLDNCPRVPNWSQANQDLDGLGDACDPDLDGDKRDNAQDNCRSVANATQIDADVDGVGDACDNCIKFPNANQLDIDGDLLGDACDGDMDGDGVLNESDNCPRQENPDQLDSDSNGIGRLCDEAEQRRFNGATEIDIIKGVLKFDKLNRPVRIPFGVCRSNCPEWMAPGSWTEAQVTLPVGMPMQIVDDRGFVLKRDRGVGTTKKVRVANDVDSARHARYLEVFPPSAGSAGKSYPMNIGILSGSEF